MKNFYKILSVIAVFCFAVFMTFSYGFSLPAETPDVVEDINLSGDISTSMQNMTEDITEIIVYIIPVFVVLAVLGYVQKMLK